MELAEYLTGRIDYDKAVQDGRKENIQSLAKSLYRQNFPDGMFPPVFEAKMSVQEILSHRDFREKIDNTAALFGWPRRYIAVEILDNPTFLSYRFSKDPKRQSIHQKAAGEFIELHDLMVENFVRLNSGGTAAKYVIHGSVSVDPLVAHNGKSVDFEWCIPNTDIQVFASHKFTGDEGGTQDNQFNDLKQFIEAASFNRNPNVVFLAIGDGPYYTDDRMVDLNTSGHAGRVNVWACRTHEIWRYHALLMRGLSSLTIKQQELVGLFA